MSEHKDQVVEWSGEGRLACGDLVSYYYGSDDPTPDSPGWYPPRFITKITEDEDGLYVHGATTSLYPAGNYNGSEQTRDRLLVSTSSTDGQPKLAVLLPSVVTPSGLAIAVWSTMRIPRGEGGSASETEKWRWVYNSITKSELWDPRRPEVAEKFSKVEENYPAIIDRSLAPPLSHFFDVPGAESMLRRLGSLTLDDLEEIIRRKPGADHI